ncbi:MAG TPA: hypothetical protein VMY42_20595 [Thermoguttaceae bacterium]|nr:hypothetical protein [Thermoguttaceae bacterium]
MRRCAVLLIGVASVFLVSRAFTQPPGAVDAVPWRILNVSRLNTGQESEDAPAAGERKYLHVTLALQDAQVQNKKHKFRVVNSVGQEVGKLWAWDNRRSVVIFEGEWEDLSDLYLDSPDHRAPLLPRVAVTVAPPSYPAPVVTVPVPVPPRPVYVPPQPVYVPPRPVYVPPRPVYVPPQPVVRPEPDRVVYADPSRVVRTGPDRVIHTGPDRVVVTGPDRVIHEGPDRVVVHDGPDRVIHEGGDRVVVHEGPDRVIHEGSDRVVVHDGSDQVVHHDGDSVVHRDGDRVVHEEGDSVVRHEGDSIVHEGGTDRVVHDGQGDSVVRHEGPVPDHIFSDGGTSPGAGEDSGEGSAGSNEMASAAVPGSQTPPGTSPDSQTPPGTSSSPTSPETPPGSETPPGTSPNAQTPPGTPSESQPPASTPPGSQTPPAAPPDSQTPPAAAPDSQTPPNAPPGSQTPPNTPPGSQTPPGMPSGPQTPPTTPPDTQMASATPPGAMPSPGMMPGMMPGMGSVPPGPGSAAGPCPPGGSPMAGPGGGPGSADCAPGGMSPCETLPGYPELARQYGPQLPHYAQAAYQNRCTECHGPERIEAAEQTKSPQQLQETVRRMAAKRPERFRQRDIDLITHHVVRKSTEDAEAGNENEVQEDFSHLVLYVACGGESGPGKVYQVDGEGRVLGIASLPSTATGIALHRDKNLILALPSDGGQIVQLDDTGRLSTILQHDRTLVHPVDVGVVAGTDTLLVTDNIAKLIAATNVAGAEPKVYQRFQTPNLTARSMSVAIAADNSVLLGTASDEGILHLSGNRGSVSAVSLLPGGGGVAADPNSRTWAATQEPNQIYLFEGQQLLTKYRLPDGRSFYRNGLLSFAPAGAVVVATCPSEGAAGPVRLLYYRKASSTEVTGGEPIRDLFDWDKEPITDFVVGPPMFWNRQANLQAAPVVDSPF